MTKTIPCPWCGGDKRVEIQHPSWGARDCPEAYIMVICPTCDGEGEIEADDEDDEERIIDCVWRHADTPFAKNH